MMGTRKLMKMFHTTRTLTIEQHYTKAKLEVNIAMKRPQRQTIDGTAKRKTLVKKGLIAVYCFDCLFGSLYRSHIPFISKT